MVEARDPSGRHKIELSQRFQELIDLVAMKKKLAGTDEYLIQWNKGAPEEHEGDPESAAKAAAEDIEGTLRRHPGGGACEVLARISLTRSRLRTRGLKAQPGEKCGPGLK